jgi:hypothetical protein
MDIIFFPALFCFGVEILCVHVFPSNGAAEVRE